MPIHELVCAVQKYEWGKSGREGSLVYELATQQQQQQQQTTMTKDGDDDAAYDHPHAELWMGTHPNGPSHVVVSGDEGSPAKTRVLLSEFLKQKQKKQQQEGTAAWMEKSGSEDQEEGQLPFLFKVLSVRTALSIQCHPDKQRAQRMHRTSPDKYKDPNHKPELCVALTDELSTLNACKRLSHLYI